MQFKTYYSADAAKQRHFELVPGGVYDATIVAVDPGNASTGTPSLNLELEITGPSQQGRHVWANIYLTPNASWKLSALCNATGISMADQLDTRQFLNKFLRIVVRQVDNQNGELRAEAVGFRKPKRASNQT